MSSRHATLQLANFNHAHFGDDTARPNAHARIAIKRPAHLTRQRCGDLGAAATGLKALTPASGLAGDVMGVAAGTPDRTHHSALEGGSAVAVCRQSAQMRLKRIAVIVRHGIDIWSRRRSPPEITTVTGISSPDRYSAK
jgi:hypothetical protein